MENIRKCVSPILVELMSLLDTTVVPTSLTAIVDLASLLEIIVQTVVLTGLAYSYAEAQYPLPRDRDLSYLIIVVFYCNCCFILSYIALNK